MHEDESKAQQKFLIILIQIQKRRKSIKRMMKEADLHVALKSEPGHREVRQTFQKILVQC